MTAPTIRRALLALVLVGLVAPATAPASKTQRSILQDDRLLVLSGAAERDRALEELTALGVDTVHSIAFWHKLAPRPTSRRRPVGFDGSDPRAYSAAAWDQYDGLVRGAAARGIDVILSPSGPIPSWASRCPRETTLARRRTCRPDEGEFARYVEALGTRYSGTYTDENEGRGVLPRVRFWSVWNEPNQGGWLTPQYAVVAGRRAAVAPRLYRGLVRAALRGLRVSGHRSDEVLLGETAPLGRRTGRLASRSTPPTEFLRDLLCIDARGRALAGSRAAVLGCRGFRRLAVTGFSHHPYTRGASAPPTTRGGPADITLATADRLRRIVRDAGRRGRVRRDLPLWYTEYGFQTNPPDDLFGVPLDDHARYINESDFTAYRDPTVRSVAQYELRDEAVLASFQTGLLFVDGRRKPAYDAYRLPLVVRRATNGRLRVWGQVRPARDGALEEVLIENAPSATGEFVTVATARTTNRKGYIDVRVPSRRGVWRLRWIPADGGPALTSRVAAVGR